jgi:hypothetical protein
MSNKLVALDQAGEHAGGDIVGVVRVRGRTNRAILVTGAAVNRIS